MTERETFVACIYEELAKYGLLRPSHGRSHAQWSDEWRDVKRAFRLAVDTAFRAEKGEDTERPNGDSPWCTEFATEVVARHLAERDHGGPIDEDAASVCEGYKDEARVLVKRMLNQQRGFREGIDGEEGKPWGTGDAPPVAYVPCARIMVGSGTDTYDPICDLREHHDGRCMSTAATDQLKLAEYPEGHPAREPHEKADALEREIHEDA